MDTHALRRMIRLRARRRGMLEVELVLERALRGLDAMGPEELEQMARVVEMDDMAIWEIITGRSSPPPWLEAWVVRLLRPVRD